MEVDLSTLESRHAHDLLTSAVIPRPISWVSTLNTKGQANIAPFSFFQEFHGHLRCWPSRWLPDRMGHLETP